jgi:cell division protein FtsB
VNSATVIALAAVGIATVTVVYTQLTARRGASGSYVSALELKLREAQSDLVREKARGDAEITRLRERVSDLEDERLNLMRKLLAKEGSG